MTDSRSSVGWKMVPSICARWSSFQLSFLKINAPLLPRSSRTGSRSRSLSPACAREGPMPRRNSFLGVLPVMIKPPIMTLSPVPTRRRVEMFKAWAGVDVAVGVAVGVAVAVAVGVAVAVAVGVAVAVAVGVAVAVAVAVGATVAVAVAVAVAVGVAV